MSCVQSFDTLHPLINHSRRAYLRKGVEGLLERMMQSLLTFLVFGSIIIDSLSNTLTHNPNQTFNFVLNQPNFTPIIHPYGHLMSTSQYNVSDLPHLRQSQRFLYDEFEVRDKIDQIAEQYKVVLEHLNGIPRFQRAALIRMSSRNLLLDGLEVWNCRKGFSDVIPENPYLIKDLEGDNALIDDAPSPSSQSTRNYDNNSSFAANETSKAAELSNTTKLNTEKPRRNATQVNIEEIERKELLQEEMIAQRFSEFIKGTNFSLPDTRKLIRAVKDRTSKLTIPQIDLTLANEFIVSLSEELQNYLPKNDSFDLSSLRQLLSNLTRGASSETTIENETNTARKNFSSQVSIPTSVPVISPNKPARIDFDELSPTEKAIFATSRQSEFRKSELEEKSDNVQDEIKVEQKERDLNTSIKALEEGIGEKNDSTELEGENRTRRDIENKCSQDSLVVDQIAEEFSFPVVEASNSPLIGEPTVLDVAADSTLTAEESPAQEEKDSTWTVEEPVTIEEKDSTSIVEEEDFKLTVEEPVAVEDKDFTSTVEEPVTTEEKNSTSIIEDKDFRLTADESLTAVENDSTSIVKEEHSTLTEQPVTTEEKDTTESLAAEEEDCTPTADKPLAAAEQSSTVAIGQSPLSNTPAILREEDLLSSKEYTSVIEDKDPKLITTVVDFEANDMILNVDSPNEGVVPAITEKTLCEEEFLTIDLRNESAINLFELGVNEIDLLPTVDDHQVALSLNKEVSVVDDSNDINSKPVENQEFKVSDFDVPLTSEHILSEENNLSLENLSPGFTFPKLFNFSAVREFILDLSEELQEDYAETDDKTDLPVLDSSSDEKVDNETKEDLQIHMFDKDEAKIFDLEENFVDDIVATHEEREQEQTRMEVEEEENTESEEGLREDVALVNEKSSGSDIEETIITERVVEQRKNEDTKFSAELKREVDLKVSPTVPNNDTSSTSDPVRSTERIPFDEPTSISKAIDYFTSEGFIGIGFIGGFFGAVVLIALLLSYREYQKDAPKQFIERFEELSSQYFQEKQYHTLIAFITFQLPTAIRYIGSEDHPVIYTVKHIMAKSQIILTSDIPAAIANLNALLDIYYLRYGEDTSVAELYEDRGIAFIKLSSYSEALSSLHQALRIYSEEALSELYDGPANPAVRHLSDITIRTPQRRQQLRMKSSPYSERSEVKVSGISSINQERKGKGGLDDFYGDSRNLTPLDDDKTETTVINTSYIEEYHAPDSDQKYYVQDMMESLHRQHRNATSTLSGGVGNSDNSMDELTPTVKLHDSNISNITADPTLPVSSIDNNDMTTQYAPYYRHSLEHEFSSQVDSLITLKELEDLIDSARLTRSPHYQYSLPHPSTYSSPHSSSPASVTSSPFPSLPRPDSTPHQDVLLTLTTNYHNFFLHLPYYHDLLTAPNESILRVCKSLGDVYLQLEEYSHAIIFYCNTFALLVKLGYEESSTERLEVVEMIQRMKEILDVSFLAKFIKVKRKAQGKKENEDTEEKETEEIHVPSLELASFIPGNAEEIRLSTVSYYDSYHLH